MQNKKTKLILSFLAIFTLVFLSGCGFKDDAAPNYQLQLEIWGLFDDQDDFGEILETYKQVNPSVAMIKYKKLTPDTYKKELLDALASGQGPDIFLIHNTWLPSFGDKLFPAPQEILSEQKFRADFVDVATNDFINQGKIYAAPLSVDSLALYYNKDLFNEAGITAPPQNWNEFVEDVRLMTKIDKFGQIVKSGAALGTVKNINRATDILNLFMLQNGTVMIEPETKRAAFDKIVKSGDKTAFPGENALAFYTRFAKNSESVYSWNPRMHYSIDAFSEGTLAMMLNYSWQKETIKDKAPKLNFAVAPVPQISGNPPVNYANYWAFAVAKNKNIENNPQRPQITNEIRTAEAWKFLTFLTTRPEQGINVTANVAGNEKVIATGFDPAVKYLEKTQKPAARRDLIESQKSDPWLGPFVTGNLITKSWPQADPDAAEAVFAEMIDAVNKGQSTVSNAVKTAATRITQTMQ